MAIVLEGDGTITGVTTFTTPLDDISFDSINVTGIVTASTFQAGTGVSMASPRSQNIALFTNNVEGLTLDDAGRLGIGISIPNQAADANNVKVVNAGIITANQYYGNQLTAVGSRVTGVGTFENGLNITGNITNGLNVSAGISTVQALQATTGSFTGNLTISNVEPTLNLTDTNQDSDFAVRNNDGTFGIRDTTNGVERFTIASDGTASVPGDVSIADKIIHTGDTDTAIRFPAADTFSVETAGSERVRIDSSGRLLLGTVTEGSATADDLTVATSGDTGITVRSGTSNSGNLFFSDGTSGNSEFRGYVQYLHSSNALLFGTNAGERARIDSVGNLNIVGVTTVAGGLLQVTSATSPAIQLSDTNNANSDFKIYSPDGDNSLRIYHVNTTSDLLSITSAGRIGIGEVSPDVPLHITGSLPGILLENSGTSSNAGDILGKIEFKHNDSDDAGITAAIKCIAEDTAGNSYLTFNNGDGGNADERIRITSDGKVGIGLVNPQDYYATELVVAAANGGGITIKTANTHVAHLMFADSTSGSDRYAGYVGYNHNTEMLLLRGDGAGGKGLNIESDGDVVLTHGNLKVPDTKGIDFSSTADGTGTTVSELLDDYEEGTWTAGAQDFDGSVTTNSSRYIKVGNVVHVQGYVSVSNTTDSSDVRITGLPFTAGGSNAVYSQMATQTSGDVTDPILRTQGGTAILRGCKYSGGDGDAKISYTDVKGKWFIFGGTYYAD